MASQGAGSACSFVRAARFASDQPRDRAPYQLVMHEHVCLPTILTMNRTWYRWLLPFVTSRSVYQHSYHFK
jgi:hypothetical protein